MSSIYNCKLIVYVLYVLLVTCLCKPSYLATNEHNIFADQQRGKGYQNQKQNMDSYGNNYPSFYRTNNLPNEDVNAIGSGTAAPKYMLELYNKFETDRYSHPMANIVRSFVNINEEEDHNTKSNKTKPGLRRHMMKFNISSVSRDEEVHLAEFRLYTLVEADRNKYHGNDRLVTIYEYNEDMTNENYVSPYQLLAKKEIYGSYSGWETFTITEPLKRWVKNNIEVRAIEVRIETVYSHFSMPDMDVESKAHRENEPLLIVFSNDKKKRKSEQRELHEMFMHYTDDNDYDDDHDGDDYEYWDYNGNYEDNNNHPNNIYKRDIDSLLKRIKESTSIAASEQKITNQLSDKSKVGSIKKMTSLARKQMLKMLYQQILDMDTDERKEDKKKDEKQLRRYPRDVFAERVKRSWYNKKRKGKRNICRKKRLEVKFKDIHWENWIIAPQSYEAFECTGRCYFPMGDNLTPTKHAIIQTLLHTNHPNKATRACCVPTKLSPISILYMDEKGVVTYKYKYEGMVVAECGCR